MRNPEGAPALCLVGCTRFLSCYISQKSGCQVSLKKKKILCDECSHHRLDKLDPQKKPKGKNTAYVPSLPDLK